MARVVESADEMAAVQKGEVLVTRFATPEATVAFDRIGALVTDMGGILSHAAVVARECGLPAVVGTREGTRTIITGKRVRVDGTAGTVTEVATCGTVGPR